MADRALPPEPEQWEGEDSEMGYLLEKWPDGSMTLCTRPLGGERWSRPVVLRTAS